MEFTKSFLLEFDNDNSLCIGVVVSDPETEQFRFVIDESRYVKEIATLKNEFIQLFPDIYQDHPEYKGGGLVGVTPIYSFKTGKTWSEEDNELSLDQGWLITLATDVLPGIDQYDEISAFDNDFAAIRYVWALAEYGSKFHRRAIEVLQGFYL